jgi:hypothetical protein
MSSTKVDDAAAKVRRGCEVLRESAQKLERAARRSSSHGLRAVRPSRPPAPPPSPPTAPPPAAP